MKNLAGDKLCDSEIEYELKKAGIKIIKHEEPLRNEVPASTTGELTLKDGRKFEFERAWYYWRVNGNVPLEVAEKLYANPVGKKDVRVVGHCGCPPPEEWAIHYDSDGVLLVKDPDGDRERRDQAVFKNFPELKESTPKHRYVRDLTNSDKRRSVVTSYHIDSQEGLNLFVKMLKKYNG